MAVNIYVKEKEEMYTNVLFVLFIIWVIALLIFYHKVFAVYYFDLGQGLLKEIVGAVILGAVMTGVTLYLWWLTAIIILICGVVLSKKFSNHIILIGCVILAVIIAIMGIRFNADMKKNEIEENQTNESSESEETERTYSIIGDNKKDNIDFDYLDDLLNAENQRNSEETVEEVYSEFTYIEDISTIDIFPSEYILKDSSTRFLTKEDLQGLSAEECRLARNEIYARNGRKFDDEGLQSYFNACSWYHGTIEPNDFQETMLSEIESTNKNLIVEYEKEMGYR